MTRNVIEAVNKAREFFDIKEFPGDFFTLLEKEDLLLPENRAKLGKYVDKLCH